MVSSSRSGELESLTYHSNASSTSSKRGRKTKYDSGETVAPHRKKYMIMAGALLLLAAGGGVGAYMATSGSSGSSQSTAGKDGSHEITTQSRSNAPPEIEGTRLMVEYGSEAAHELAKSCAMQVLQDYKDDKVIIFHGNGLCKKKLEDMAAEGDADTKVAFDSQLTLHRVGGTRLLNKEQVLARSLQDAVPWGVEMIELDDVTLGTAENVTICVVDSGLAVNHPEFGGAANSRISGNDAQRFWGEAWSWRQDGNGHGTHV